MTLNASEGEHAMPNNWITCEHCGEKRNLSGDYTSPDNYAKDSREWAEQHESGLCSAQVREDHEG